MKKLLFAVPVIFLLAAGCNSNQPTTQQTQPVSQTQVTPTTQQQVAQNPTPTQQTTPVQSQPSIVSGQKYIVTAKIQPSPKEVSFSILNTDGKAVKTILVPSDLITGSANNVKVLGGQIYYMSGSYKNTSIGAIDVQTGQSKILNFTKTNNTNLGNGLYAIVDWDVSADNSKVAWMNTDGKIMVANIDGSNLQTYDSGIVGKPTGNRVKLIGNYLYFDTFSGAGSKDYLQQVNLNNGSVKTVVNDLWPGTYAISDSGNYVAYISNTGGSSHFVVKNIQTNTAYTVPNIGEFENVAFTPDESKIIFLPFDGPGSNSPLTTVDLSNGQTTMGANNVQILGFVSNSRMVISSGSGLMVTDLAGGNATKISSDFFKGILTSK